MVQPIDFTQSEDIILILDSGSSAYMEDLPPSRMAVIASAVNLFAEKRHEADKRDRYFLIEAGDKVIEWFTDLIDDPRQVAQRIATLIPRPALVTPEPKLVEAFGKALERHIRTFKTVGNKTLRVIIIGGGNAAASQQNIADMCRKVAARMAVIVDAVKIGVEYPPHLYRAASDLTRGKYNMATTPEELYQIFQDLSAKKEVLKPTYSASQEPPKQKTFLEIIAADLAPLTPENANSKCQICFSTAPQDVIRQCPSCKKVLHLPCAGKWAENQNLGFPNVFRCPFCFALLKVPRDFVDFQKFLAKFQDAKKDYQDARAGPGAAVAEANPKVTSLFEQELAATARREELTRWVLEKMPSASKYQINPIVEEILKAERANDVDAYLRFLRDVKGFDTRDFPK